MAEAVCNNNRSLFDEVRKMNANKHKRSSTVSVDGMTDEDDDEACFRKSKRYPFLPEQPKIIP